MKLKFVILSLLICSAASAQKISIKEKLADKYYNNYSYYKAIPLYEELKKSSPKNLRICEKLADSYKKINDSENAERCYSFLVENSSVKPEYLLCYAQALARNGKYDKATKWYQKYWESKPDDIRGIGFPDAYINIESLFADSASFSVTKAPFNSETSDFSPAYFGNDIVYVSARKKASVIRSVYNRTSSSYLDLFMTSPESTAVKSFSDDINSRYHEGPVTFTRNLDTIFFTRSNFYNKKFGKSSEGINKLKLYMAEWNENSKRWTNITPLPFNNDQYSVGHPSLSPDGKTLYFASDMPGSIGGTDIYSSQISKNPSGQISWGDPVNLGAGINTAGNEMFPFIDRDGNLWFASDGIPGLGGLDVFMARKNSKAFLKPVNPGYPLNTRFDDFGYITKNGGRDGYVSSDRNNTPGNDDIFRVKRASKILPILVTDSKSNKPVSSAVIVSSVKGSKSETQVTSQSGAGKLDIKPSSAYSFDVTRERYDENKFEMSAEKLEDLDTLKIQLVSRTPKFIVTGKVYSADSFNPVPNSTAYLVKKDGTVLKEVKCDEKGDFSFELEPESDYTVKVNVTVNGSKCSSNSNECSTKGLTADMTFNQAFPVFCVGDVIKVENIYYDLGKFNIRPDAAVELDKLLDIMKANPEMKIELRSHTDSRGTPSSNMILSEKRAHAAAEYLFSKGIDRNRIASKGYGDTMPLNKCIKGVICTEDEYKVNRRTEFKILSVE